MLDLARLRHGSPPRAAAAAQRAAASTSCKSAKQSTPSIKALPVVQSNNWHFWLDPTSGHLLIARDQAIHRAMKSTVFCLIVIAVCLLIYNRQHPFGRPSIPEGHEYAADADYLLHHA